MSQPTQQSQADQLDNAAGAILGVIIVIIFILIASDRRPLAPQEQDTQPPEVAVSVPTATPLPTQTSVPVTATLPPTATPLLPTNTPSPVPPTEMPSDAPTEESTEQPSTDQTDTNNSEYDPLVVLLGEAQFIQCVACHGEDARGIPNLGKDLVDSEFVQSSTDEELVDFIKIGRPIWDANNTTGLDMPPKGGNPALTDEDIVAIVAYLRSLAEGDDEAVPQDDTSTNGESSDTETSDSPAGDTNAEYDPLVVLLGEAQFIQCVACHGEDARGIPNLGKDLVDSELVQSSSDEELVDFIKIGRPIWDANNTTGLDMPPKGGNPALTDEDIVAIVAYLRSLADDPGVK